MPSTDPPTVSFDLNPVNANWPKATPDTSADLGLDWDTGAVTDPEIIAQLRERVGRPSSLDIARASARRRALDNPSP